MKGAPRGMSHIAETCILHIGVPKTGSTALQQSLHAGHAALLARGVLYPAQMANHKFIVSAMMDDPGRFDIHRLAGRPPQAVVAWNDRQMQAFAAAQDAARPRALLLSSEHCLLLKPAELARLHDHLTGIARTVRVLAYVRHPLAHARSRIQESVKNGVKTLEQALARPLRLEFDSAIEDFATAFGRENVSVRAFPGDRGGDVVADFLGWIGLGDLDLPVQRSNESLSHPALLLADALTGIAPRFSPQRAARIAPLLARIRGPKVALPPGMPPMNAAKVAVYLAYFDKTWGVTLDPPPDSAAPAAAFTDETVRALAELLNEMALELEQRETPKDKGRKP